MSRHFTARIMSHQVDSTRKIKSYIHGTLLYGKGK